MLQDQADTKLVPPRGVRPRAEGRRKVAFVLTGGASRAAVQVGMLEALTDAGVRPDLLVGTSAGAVNAVAFAADPTRAGLLHLTEGWRRARRSRVFPLWSTSLVLGPIGRRDHVLTNRGLAALIREFVGIQRLEAGVIPAHVVVTDRSNREPVVLSEGPVLPALLASTAIPGIFPPIEIGGRMLVDGGVASDTPTRQAELLGASTTYVLPALGPQASTRRVLRPRVPGVSVDAEPSDGAAVVTIGGARSSVVHVMPVPATETVSPYDFRQSARLIDEAAALARDWLARLDTTPQPAGMG